MQECDVERRSRDAAPLLYAVGRHEQLVCRLVHPEGFLQLHPPPKLVLAEMQVADLPGLRVSVYIKNRLFNQG